MAEENQEQIDNMKLPTCGLVMPISAMEGCSELHWRDVLDILTDAIRGAGFESLLVSDADDVGIIQKRIIQNLYNNPIIVCDVSGKNPNVMFELGMRLAFDRPAIIVKDDKTTYSFDTQPIEHLEYPRDLRFNKIVEFKKSLQTKIKATYDMSCKDPNYTTFLKNYGSFTVPKLETIEVGKEDFILTEITDLRQMMQKMYRQTRQPNYHNRVRPDKNALNYDNNKDIEGEINEYRNFKALTNIMLTGGEASPSLPFLIKNQVKQCRIKANTLNAAEYDKIADALEELLFRIDKFNESLIEDEIAENEKS